MVSAKNVTRPVVTEDKLDVAFGPEKTTPPPAWTGSVTATLADALAAFQEHLPQVLKGETATVTSEKGSYRYRYADLADVSEAVLPALGRVGLSFSAMPTYVDGAFQLVYTLAHAGSGEHKTGYWPLPDPAREKAQVVGSALTYARRYALLAVTGVAPQGDDDDGKAASERNHREPEVPVNRSMPDTLVASLKRTIFNLESSELAIQLARETVLGHGAVNDPVPGDPRGRTWRQVFEAREQAIALGAQRTDPPAAMGSAAGGSPDPATTTMYFELHAKLMAAKTPEGIDLGVQMIGDAFGNGEITQEEQAALLDAAERRQDEIESRPSPGEATDGEYQDEIPPAASRNLDDFREMAAMALRAPAVIPALRDLMTGEIHGYAAHTADEYVIVRDTIAAAFGREKVISEATKIELLKQLDEHLEMDGVRI